MWKAVMEATPSPLPKFYAFQFRVCWVRPDGIHEDPITGTDVLLPEVVADSITAMLNGCPVCHTGTKLNLMCSYHSDHVSELVSHNSLMNLREKQR